MSFEAIALLIDTYWMFLAGALVIGIAVGWIAATSDTNTKDSSAE